MEVSSGSDVPKLLVYYFSASLLFYLGIAVGSLLPGGDNEGLLERAAFPLFLCLTASVLTFRLAWLLRRPGSPHLKARGLQITLPLSLGAVLMGALLISVALLREQWAQLFWNR